MNPGKRFEQKFARGVRGARRTPGSGNAGGGDTSFEPGSLWSDWSFELKHRKALPRSLVTWLGQAETDIAIGDRRHPALAMQEDHGRTIVAFYWQDLAMWVDALAEVGNAAALKTLVRQLKRQVAEIEAAIR